MLQAKRAGRKGRVAHNTALGKEAGKALSLQEDGSLRRGKSNLVSSTIREGEGGTGAGLLLTPSDQEERCGLKGTNRGSNFRARGPTGRRSLPGIHP